MYMQLAEVWAILPSSYQPLMPAGMNNVALLHAWLNFSEPASAKLARFTAELRVQHEPLHNGEGNALRSTTYAGQGLRMAKRIELPYTLVSGSSKERSGLLPDGYRSRQCPAWMAQAQLRNDQRDGCPCLRNACFSCTK